MSFGDRQSGRSTRAYIANLIEKGHESVLEHANWSLIVDDVSRGFTHQLVRHRVGVAFSQLSQQYVDQADERFFSLPLASESEELSTAIAEAFQSAKRTYVALGDKLSVFVDRRYPTLPAKEKQRLVRTLARSILPNGTSTVVAMTVNARAARHVLSVRGSVEGDLEMREFSALLFTIMQAEAPSVVADFCLSVESELPIVRRLVGAKDSETSAAG